MLCKVQLDQGEKETHFKDTLGGFEIILTNARDASSAFCAVPFVYPVLSGAIAIVRTIQKVQDDRMRGSRLAQRASDLAIHVNDMIGSESNINQRLQHNLKTLISVMEEIQSDIERHLQRGLLGRILRHSSISALLDGHMDTLERARDSFYAIAMISMHQKLYQYARENAEMHQRLEEYARASLEMHQETINAIHRQ